MTITEKLSITMFIVVSALAIISNLRMQSKINDKNEQINSLLMFASDMSVFRDWLQGEIVDNEDRYEWHHGMKQKPDADDWLRKHHQQNMNLYKARLDILKECLGKLDDKIAS